MRRVALSIVCLLAWAASAQDAGLADAGVVDAGGLDAGGLDAGGLDAGDRDGGDASDGGPDAGEADAGPVDAGFDAGFDAGPKPPPGEGYSCDPSAPVCQGNLLCVPYPSFPQFGTCRAPCDDSDGPASCLPGRTCQTIYDRDQLAPLFSACAPPTTYRDGACQAPLDEDACGLELDCLVTRVADATFETSMNCKQLCDVEAADAGCAAPERCFVTTLIQEVQTGAGGNTVTCDVAACASGGSCPCDDGHECLETVSGGVCAYAPGECGTPVDGLILDDLTDAGFVPFENLCNTVTGHRFCDNEAFEGIDNGGVNLCLFQGQLGVADEGLCLPFCGNATFDDNNNGTIDPMEVEPVFACPEGQVCTRRLARELLLGPGPQDLFGPFGVKGCQLADCPSGQRCPACGAGELECLRIPDGPEAGFDGVCIAPTRTCDEPPPGFDDGPVFEFDAGPPADAGAPPATVDAGFDAGAEPTGPGLGTDGPTVERPDDCACSAPLDGRAAPLGLWLALLALVGGRRRRR